MLLANKQVASFAGNRKAPLPFVYRIHDEPDADKLNNLQMVVSSLGYKLDLKNKDVSKSLNVLLIRYSRKTRTKPNRHSNHTVYE